MAEEDTSMFSSDSEQEDSGDEKPEVRELDPEVLRQLVLQDIRLSMRAKRHQMRRCLFFHVVEGGNVETVESVLDFLERGGHRDELDWVLNRPDRRKQLRVARNVRKLVQVLVFVLYCLLLLVTTPLFYLLHAAGIMFRTSNRQHISEDPQLPLVFALYSMNPDMLRLFFQRGVTLSDTDADNNNICHYLSDLSTSAPQQAIDLHNHLMSFVDDEELVRNVILHQENKSGLTPLELCARWGSMELGHLLILQKGFIRENLVSINKESVWVDNNYLCKQNSRKYIIGIIKPDVYKRIGDMQSAEKAQLEVAEYDVRRYERGDTLGKQSYLLQLIAARHVGEMTDQGIKAFLSTDFLHCWMKRKRRRYMTACVVSHVVHVAVTVLLLLYLLHFGGDMNPMPLLQTLVQNYVSVGLELLRQSQATDSSQQIYGSAHGNYSGPDIKDLIPVCYNKSRTIGNVLMNQCLARGLEMILDTCEGLSIQNALDNSGARLFSGDTFNQENNAKLTLYILEAFMLCHLCLDYICRVTFLVRNLKTTRTFPYFSSLAVTTRRFPGSYMEKQLAMLMYSLFTGYVFVFWNLEQSLTSYFTAHFHNKAVVSPYVVPNSANVAYSNNTADIYSVPASTGNQVGVTESADPQLITDQFLPMLNSSLQMMSYLLIACLIVRFLLLIHVMRLFPNVGFFVITARKMSQHLVEFVLIFLLVAIAFATVFHFVMRDPECPANRVEGFSGLAESLFSTYLIAIGQAEFIYFKNANAQIAFVVYTVITVLLLFNLVIAVMSTTAADLNRKSWRKALSILETWNETLGIEAACQTLYLPLNCCLSLWKCACFKCLSKLVSAKENGAMNHSGSSKL